VTVLILVGTRKGLFQLEGDESPGSWTVQEPTLTGWPRTSACPSRAA
jgi:hypothetical protein